MESLLVRPDPPDALFCYNDLLALGAMRVALSRGLRLRRGSSGAGSTGLGLDIARRVAESAGGDLNIERSALGGAQVQLRLRTWTLPPGGRRARRRKNTALPGRAPHLKYG